MNQLKAIYIIWYRDILRFWRNRIRLVSSLAMPFLWLVMFGSGIKGSISFGAGSFSGADFDYVQFLFPGVIGMTILFTSIFSAISIVTDREFGFMKEILVAPVSRTAVALGKIFGGSTIALFQGMLMMVLAPLVGVKLSVGLVLGLLPVMLLMAFSLNCLGILVASRIKSTEAFQMVMQFIMMPMFFLSGSLFPLKNLPGWMSFLSKINPASYGIDSLRQVAFKYLEVPEQISQFFKIELFGETVSLLNSLLIVTAFGLVMLVLAIFFFRRSN
ncbi:ABC transporter permease [Patescibacteria group bacterium]|nr:ABC transporter permease [Patescibacteria group bacterium]